MTTNEETRHERDAAIRPSSPALDAARGVLVSESGVTEETPGLSEALLSPLTAEEAFASYRELEPRAKRMDFETGFRAGRRYERAIAAEARKPLVEALEEALSNIDGNPLRAIAIIERALGEASAPQQGR